MTWADLGSSMYAYCTRSGLGLVSHTRARLKSVLSGAIADSALCRLSGS